MFFLKLLVFFILGVVVVVIIHRNSVWLITSHKTPSPLEWSSRLWRLEAIPACTLRQAVACNACFLEFCVIPLSFLDISLALYQSALCWSSCGCLLIYASELLLGLTLLLTLWSVWKGMAVADISVHLGDHRVFAAALDIDQVASS